MVYTPKRYLATAALVLAVLAGAWFGPTRAVATIILDVFTSSKSGLVPASGGGTANFLRADGTFNPPPGGGSSSALTTSTFSGLPGASGSWGPVRLLTDNIRGLFVDVPTIGWTSANGQVINVKLFGAKGDSSTDDTTAIQNAANQMTAAGVANGANVLYFPPGIYKLTSAISLTNGGIVAGQGDFLSIIRSTTASANWFTVAGSVTGRVVFRDLYFDATVTKTSPGTGIKFNATGGNTHTVIDNVIISGAYIGVDMDGSRWSIRNTVITETISIGLKIDNSLNWDDGDSSLTGSVLINNAASGDNIQLIGGGGFKAVGNKLLSGNYGFHVRPRDTVATDADVNTTNIVDLQFIGNSIEGQAISGIYWETPSYGPTGVHAGTNNTIIQQSIISDNQIGLNGNIIGITLTGRINFVVVANNLVNLNGSAATAMYFDSATTQITATGNNIWMNGGTSQGFNIQAASGIASGNYCSGCGSGGLYAGTTLVIDNLTPLTLAQLPSSAPVGSRSTCSDCTVGSNPCAASGGTVGTVATRIGGPVWKCQ